MKCKCGKEKEEHYVSVGETRKAKLKNITLWCYPLRKDIPPRDKRYFMKYSTHNKDAKESK